MKRGAIAKQRSSVELLRNFPNKLRQLKFVLYLVKYDDICKEIAYSYLQSPTKYSDLLYIV